MTRQKTTPADTAKHAPMILSAAHYYARAAARYHRARQAQQPQHIAKARFLEASTYIDKILTGLVFRTGHKGRTITTATQAARIKAAAQNLADCISENPTAHELCPHQASRTLTLLILEILQVRQLEGAGQQPEVGHLTPVTQQASQAIAA